MTTQLKRVEDVTGYCPDCTTCFLGNPEVCPECGESRSEGSWRPIELCPHSYLGYELAGRYLLDRYLGGGASGVVYRATDRKLNRPFALKIVELGGYDDAEGRAEQVRRFRNEVETLSRLRNPHVINIFESFELDDDVSALLTQYIDGVSLEEMLGEGPVEFERALTVVRQVANGLHEAHEQNVVHRDVKPGNIMIEELPAAGIFARVLDFGLVHLLDDASQTRGFRGTPLYAAPEQCTSERAVDRRADIYALGCVLFHTLSGRPPFDGETAIEIIEAHCKTSPPRLDEVMRDPVPPKLVDLVDRSLCKDPDDRPKSLRTFIRVLDSIATEQTGRVVREPEISEPGLAPENSGGRRADRSPEDGESSLRTSEGWLSPSTSDGLGRERTLPSEEIPAELLQTVDLEEYFDSYTVGAACVRLEENGSGILVADAGNRIHVLGRGGRAYSDSFEGARMRVADVTSRLSRGEIYAAEMNGRVLQWRIDDHRGEPSTIHQFSNRVLALDIDPASTTLAAGLERGDVESVDLRTGESLVLCSFDAPVCQVSVVPGGESLVAATIEGEVELVQLGGPGAPERKSVASIAGEPGGLLVDEHLRWCAILDREGRIDVVPIEGDSESFCIEPVPPEVRSLSHSEHGQILGVTIERGDLRLWAFHHVPIRERAVFED